LSYVFQTNPGVRWESGTPSRALATTGWEGGMPSTFGTATFANYKFSLYCTCTTQPITTKILGNTTVYSSIEMDAARRAIPITFTEAGSIESISIYHNAGTGSVLLGVYADQSGSPTSRLGVTPSTAVSATTGWQTVALTSPVPVTSGQTVWLSYVFQTNPGVRWESGTPSRALATAGWEGGMPSTFGTATFANYKFSIYCTYATTPGDEAEFLKEPVEMNTVNHQEEEVLIYPNPTEGEFTVSWKNKYDHRLVITIYNITGQIVKEVQTEPDMNEIKFNLNRSSNGIYLLDIKDRKNDLILNRSRIIKRR